jgi:hypothetical protein
MSLTQTVHAKGKEPKSPYSSLPDHCFWSPTHPAEGMSDIDPVVKGHFLIDPDWKIASAGNCFAEYIAKHLKENGYNYFMPEGAHPIINDVVAESFNYGKFSARYGNIFTARQMLQLAMRVRGLFQPEESVWLDGDSRIDPYRPKIQPHGFSRQDDFIADRERHFAAVRRILNESDLFVFTFGTTEGWVSLRDGAVFPFAPGIAGGSFDTRKHAFINFTVAEIVEDFRAFVALMREDNPNVRVLMTVSHEPLLATARIDQSVMAANSYSKAALRVACEELQASVDNCFYFPSYEVMANSLSRGVYCSEGPREVEAVGAKHAISLFMRHYTRDIPEKSQRSSLPRMETAIKNSTHAENTLRVPHSEHLNERKKK